MTAALSRLWLGLGLGSPQITGGEEITATPVITRDGPGLYEITCATEGALIYYTTNGETPTADSAIYSIPLSIIQPTTLKAIAIKDEISSEVVEMVITESVWTIPAAADGTKIVRIRCATTGQTLTAAGGAEIKLDGEWGTSVEIPAGAVNRNIYFRGNGTGGTLTIPSSQNITYLYISGNIITGSINGMSLTYLYLNGTSTSITGSITGMPLTELLLSAPVIITGVPPAIGKTLSSFRVIGGSSYDYPWTEQTFLLPARTWTATTMSIDCRSTVGVVEFNTWLLGLASVSNAGTATLTLKNTPTVDALTAAGLVGAGSGYYAMTTTLGYTLTLGE